MSDEYKSYGARSRRTWDQMGYDVEHAGLLERKLASNLQSLKKFNGDVTEYVCRRFKPQIPRSITGNVEIRRYDWKPC